jgi:hypothetical protein
MMGGSIELQSGDEITVAVLPDARRRIDTQAVHQQDGLVTARPEPEEMRREDQWRRIAVICFVTNREAHLTLPTESFWCSAQTTLHQILVSKLAGVRFDRTCRKSNTSMISA